VSYPFDDIVEHYDEDHFHVEVAQRMIDGLPSGFTASSVLDVGTGTGMRRSSPRKPCALGPSTCRPR
jgi:ubiquinone/menaquinone biosynthesis C-methylase UbiE